MRRFVLLGCFRVLVLRSKTAVGAGLVAIAIKQRERLACQLAVESVVAVAVERTTVGSFDRVARFAVSGILLADCGRAVVDDACRLAKG